MFDNKRPLHVIFLFFLLVCSQLYAIDTEAIDQVLKKGDSGQMLDDDDQQTIADFWDQAIEEMLITEDLNEIVEIKSVILSKKSRSTSGDYYNAFTQAAKETITAALKELNTWDNAEVREHIKINLLILAAQIQSMKLIDFAFQGLDAQSAIVRYWSVKAITGDFVVERLNSEIISDEDIVERIFSAIDNVIKNEHSGEIFELAINLLTKLDSAEAKQLMLEAVDRRLEAYENWTVSCEIMDTAVLTSVGNEILTETKAAKKAELTQKFAQLYSYIMQRYIIGKNTLIDTQKQELASVMIHIEHNMLGKLLEKPQSSIKRAIEKRSITSLKREHDTLLGTSSLTGELARKIEFDYGKNPGGRSINAPKTLLYPPAPGQ